MPTKVVQIDLAAPILPVEGLAGYQRIWMLVRYGRRPIGWVRCARSITGPTLRPETIRNLVCQQLGLQVWDTLRTGLLPAAPRSAPPISIIICTRDHPDLLRRQLQSIAKLVYPCHEVLVIDNAPRHDGTQRICAEFPFVRRILEPAPGLDYARNTGWRNARYDIVAYTDDDATVDPHWLAAIGEAFADEHVQCVTGLTLPMLLETPAQEFFEMYGGMQRGFRRRVYRPGAWNTFYPLGSGHFGTGANLALRRSMLQRLGGFDDALDTGSLTRGGGDLDIMASVIRAGGTLVYEPLALAWHEHRRTMPQLEGQMFDYGFGFFAYLTKYARHDLELQNHALKLMKKWFAWWGVKRLARNVKDALRLRPHFPIGLILREMLGFVFGPPAYARARRRVRYHARKRRSREVA